ncbi:NfeD family protein [Marinococcus luteus]|uniref:NfeD family protein n=1 Tax=Marinococcus luteus TaxID=1122204 RepID=UPI002ACCE0A2|nr:nodulation protein NfeD [Marinococcus luteus]MDZ5782946.1 nodulation protein NfeD [Marinococcus luteus]
MEQRKSRWLSVLLAILFMTAAWLPASVQGAGENQTVYVIPVEQTVEQGMAAFLERSVEEAEEADADRIIFELDTPGGAVDAAGEIASIINGTSIPTTAYVTDQAMSAGAFLALSADEIAMAPETEMGAAQVIDGSGNAASDKAQSAWVSNMVNAAESNDREPVYAEAMADPGVELPDYRAGEGELLTLTASEAASDEVGYAEYIADSRDDLLSQMNLGDAAVEEADISAAEQIARWVTSPYVIPILLSVGMIGLILEVFSPGFGIFGGIGLASLGLFFFGHMIAGFAGFEGLLLFGVGLILLLIEFFVPGFGIFGILGIGAVVGSLFMSSFSVSVMALSVVLAAVAAIIAAVVMVVGFGKRGPMKKLVLQDTFSSKEGYVSNEGRTDLLGREGTALTPLHPTGAVDIDGEKIDVVSDGRYLDRGDAVQVVRVEGTRVVVKPYSNKERRES